MKFSYFPSQMSRVDVSEQLLEHRKIFLMKRFNFQTVQNVDKFVRSLV